MNPLSLLGIWGYVGIGVVAAGLAVGGTHYVDANVYGNQIKDLKLGYANTQIDNANKAFDRLSHRIDALNIASNDYEANRKILSDQLDKIHGDFLNAIKKNPLPPDCRPDAERVRQLDEAIERVNGPTDSGTLAGFGETVRSNPETSP